MSATTAPPRTGNEIGRMTGLTLLTPVRPTWLLFLRLGFFVSWHAKVFNRHILQFNFIKFVRWTVVRDLPGIWVQFSHAEIEYYEQFASERHIQRQREGREIWDRR